MNEQDSENGFSLIPYSSRALAVGHGVGNNIVTEMVGQALALTRWEMARVKSAKRRIGDYDFCEPDYRQIHIWADDLALEPEEVIRRLLDDQSLLNRGVRMTWMPTTEFKNGKIIKLNWDFRLLPVTDFKWVGELEIEYLRLSPAEGEAPSISSFRPLLPKLTVLYCDQLGIDNLDLSGAPLLTEIYCSANRASELNLSGLPLLTKLYCYSNRLVELDLSGVPLLTKLRCGANQLRNLNLSLVPILDDLYCDHNQLKELDLSGVSMLRELSCGSNQLTYLDLSVVPELESLSYSSNHITSLDLSFVPKLRGLSCESSQITSLDLSVVHKLESLWCNSNQIKNLDLSVVPELDTLSCESKSTQTS